MRWTKSLRFQLMLGSLATTAIVLLLASCLCYALVQAALERETDQALQNTAAGLLRRMAPDELPEPGDPPLEADPAAVVRGTHLVSVSLPGVGNDALCLRLARINGGQTVALSPALASAPDLQAVLSVLPARPRSAFFAGTGDDTRLRCFFVGVPNSPYVLQVAAPWDPAEDLLTELTFGMALASLLFLLLSGIGSGLLVGRALRPMNSIVAEAEALTPDRLSAVQLGPQALSDTEIGHLVAALNRMLARISGAFSAQRRFSADASHELRTPLTILRGQFELALSRPRTDAEYRNTLESGLEEVGRMTRIVESLIQLARGEAPGPLSRFGPLPLAALAGTVCESLAGHAAARDIRLVCASDDDATVSGDPDSLRRLLQNLVENAVAYTPPGGTVTVTTSADAETCRVRVADTGIGISPADLPHIFERFFRADPARAVVDSSGGSGLGLSIVQSIAGSHGGTVTAESTLGEGSEFILTLPAAHPA